MVSEGHKITNINQGQLSVKGQFLLQYKDTEGIIFMNVCRVQRPNKRHVSMLCLCLSGCLTKRSLEFHCKAVEY